MEEMEKKTSKMRGDGRCNRECMYLYRMRRENKDWL
jgi:hypothetical protein